jgi:uncharacterized DUF497 family protein
MNLEWNHAKSQLNLYERGFGFEIAIQLEWDCAIGFIDDRKDYGELRIRALAPIDSRLYAIAYTLRDKAIRVISLRKANAREVKYYEET